MAKRSQSSATRGRGKASRGRSSKGGNQRPSNKASSAGNVTFVFLHGDAKIDYSAVAVEVDALRKLDTIEAIEARLREIETEKGPTFRQAVATGIAPHVLKLGLRFTQNWLSDQGQAALKSGREQARRGLNWLGGVFKEWGDAMTSDARTNDTGSNGGGDSKPQQPDRH